MAPGGGGGGYLHLVNDLRGKEGPAMHIQCYVKRALPPSTPPTCEYSCVGERKPAMC